MEEFAGLVGGVILKPPHPSCFMGSSTTYIDFFILSPGIASKVKGYFMGNRFDAKPHRCWGLLLGGTAVPLRARELVLPRPLPLELPDEPRDDIDANADAWG